MSYQDGWAAMNLDMPSRIPRTEYSASTHWELVKAVTGIAVDSQSLQDTKNLAERAFVKSWNYDFVWSATIFGKVFDQYQTSMGHAVYADAGADYDNRISCPFKEPEDVLAFDPWEKLGHRDKKEIMSEFESHYRANCEAYPDAVNMAGIYVSLVSGLIDLFGWDLLLTAAGIDPQGFGAVANAYSSWIQQYFNALSDADVPVVMIHDDIVWTSGAFLHPDWYRSYVFPNLKKQLAPLVESGKKILFTSDGTYTEFVDDIVECGVHGFVMEPTTDMKLIAEKYGKTHVIVGNADTRVLLSGTKNQIRAEVERCMDIGRSCPGFFMAVGNHIPSNTPVENALYYNEVYNELCRR